MLKRPAIVFFMVMAVILSAVSCGQKSGPAPAMTGGKPGTLTADAGTAFNILPQLPLMKETDGKLSYVEAIPLGDKVTLVGEPAKKTDPYSKTEKDFITVRTEGAKEGWARLDYLISNCTLGVVVAEDSMIYSQPKNEAATVDVLPNLCVIAIAKDFSSQNFVKATTVEPVKSILKKDIYLRKESLTVNLEDVASARLYLLAKRSTDIKQKTSFLKGALTDYPNSVFASMVNRYMNALSLPDAGKTTEAYVANLTVLENGVNVRQLPDEDFGTVLKTLKKDDVVISSLRTTESYTIKDATAPWYKIDSPAGWVFGKYLKYNDPSQGPAMDEDSIGE